MKLYNKESLRKTVKFLREQPEVTDIKFKDGKYLFVRFNKNFVEYWSYDRIDISKFFGRHHQLSEDDLYPFDDRWPEFRCQFTRHPDDPDFDIKGKFFIYTPSYLNEFKICNVRVFLHRLSNSLEKEGFVQPWIPDDYLNRLLNRLDDVDWGRIKIDDNNYKEKPMISYLVRDIITLQNFDIKKDWKSNNIFVSMDHLYNINKPITRSNIIWYMRRRRKTRFHAGYSIGLSGLVKDKFENKKIVNHSDQQWVDAASAICKKHGGGDVHVADKRIGYDNEIIIGSGKFRIIGPRPDNSDFVCVDVFKNGERI